MTTSAGDPLPRVLRPRRAAPADAVRPTRAEVNLASLRHNLRVLRREVGRETGGRGAAAIWGVLKADAYGHGAPAVARTLERAGIDGVCVALLEEAIELRDAGIALPVLVLGGHYGQAWGEVLARRLTPVVYERSQIAGLAAAVRLAAAPPLAVHLKVDTGMARLGATLRELDGLLEALRAAPEVRLEGVMTHLACADGDDLEPTRAQLLRFDEALARVRAAGFSPRVLHAANSAALVRLGGSRLDAVRPGVALYGVSPRPGLLAELRPAMRVRTEIIALRQLDPGERAGYGHTWEARRPSVLATVPMGYADGLSRKLGNCGHALVRGRRVPLAGAVSMDLTTLDVTDVPGVALRDEVVVLGAQEGALGRDAITAEEIAAHTGTIPWEVLTSVSRRVPRFYREP